MSVTQRSQTEDDQGLERLVRNLAGTLAASDEALEAVNAANRSRFHEMCATLGLTATDAVALLCRPPEVTLTKARVAASVRLTATKIRETGVTLRIGGRVVDSFYQKRFGTESTTYQRITVDFERVTSLDELLVTDGSERSTVQSLLRAFAGKSKAATGEDIEFWVQQARRFARVQTFARLWILRTAAGWACLLPPSPRSAHVWSSLYLTRSGEVRSPVPSGIRVTPMSSGMSQDFATALSSMEPPGNV